MSKRKQRKTRKQKQQRQPEPPPKLAPTEVISGDDKPEPRPVPATNLTPAEAEFEFVGRETRKILLITATFVAIEVGLWLLFSRTGFEAKLTSLIKF